MIALAAALILAGPARAAVPAPLTDPPQYERLMTCYVRVMEARGVKMESPDSLLARYDRLARRRCARQIRAYRRLVGRAMFEADWKALWDEYWSRL